MDDYRRRFKDLLDAAKQGDHGAFDELTRPLLPVIRRVASQSLSRKLAGFITEHDMTQTTLTAAFVSIQKFKGSTPEELEQWLVTTCRNKSFDENRKYVQSDRRGRVKKVSLDQSNDAGIKLREMVPDSQPTPRQELLRIEQSNRLYEAMQRLSPREREAISLQYFEGLAINEIAERMDLSFDAVCGLLRRGRRKLCQFVA